MADILANMTQIIMQSPQVTTLVAGEAAAADHIKRMNQIEESKRQREALRVTVLSAEGAARIGESEEEAHRRLEEENKRLIQEEERQRKRQARKAARSAKTSAVKEEAASGCAAASPFEPQPVIDVCV